MTFTPDLCDTLEIPEFLRRPLVAIPRPAAPPVTTQPQPIVVVPVVPVSPETMLRQEADQLWRNWMPTREDRTRPRKGTFLKRLRKQLAKQQGDVMSKIGPKSAANRAFREKKIDRLSSSANSLEDCRQPQPSGSEQPQETTMKTATKTQATTPKKAPKTSARRKVKSTAARAPKVKAPKEPKGMVVEILKLSSRTNGVSPAELNELTKWKGAPWKWLFSNPKKTGYCDRWSYSFKVIEGKDGETRYKTDKK